MTEPEIALAASPRGWPQRLQLHVADHGGARVRATVLHPRDALAEGYDVFVVDDTTSFLTRRLVAELHGQGRRVLGVYDPEDPRGKTELADLGVDAACDRHASADVFLTTIVSLAGDAATARPDPAPASTASLVRTVTARAPRDGRGPDGPPPRGRITAVGSPTGGCGATELAVALAAAVGGRGEACTLVDADEVAPALAQRLGLAPYPNIRAAVDAVEDLAGELDETLTAVTHGRFWALPGLATAADWPQLRPLETTALVAVLARTRHQVLVNVGHRVEDLPTAAGAGRYGSTRALLAEADAVVGVGLASPVGLTRLLDWTAEVQTLAPEATVHLVLNHAPRGSFKRQECGTEILRTVTPASLSWVPHDPRVPAAAWGGHTVPAGPFTRAVNGLATLALPRLAPPVGRGRRRRYGRRSAHAGPAG